jgi:hypothetical protein
VSALTCPRAYRRVCPAALPWPAELAALALKISLDGAEQAMRGSEDPPLTTHPLPTWPTRRRSKMRWKRQANAAARRAAALKTLAKYRWRFEAASEEQLKKLYQYLSSVSPSPEVAELPLLKGLGAGR